MEAKAKICDDCYHDGEFTLANGIAKIDGKQWDVCNYHLRLAKESGAKIVRFGDYVHVSVS